MVNHDTNAIPREFYEAYRQLEQRCADLERRCAELLELCKSLKEENAALKSENAELRRALYGKSSERTKRVPENPYQMLLGLDEPEPLLFQQTADDQSQNDAEIEITVKGHKRRLSTNKKDTLRSALEAATPIETVHIA